MIFVTYRYGKPGGILRLFAFDVLPTAKTRGILKHSGIAFREGLAYHVPLDNRTDSAKIKESSKGRAGRLPKINAKNEKDTLSIERKNSSSKSYRDAGICNCITIRIPDVLWYV